MSRELNVDDLLKRVSFNVDINSVCLHVSEVFNLGNIQKITPLLVGHEEFNCKIETQSGSFVIKFLNKRKGRKIAQENIDVFINLQKNDIPVPQLIKNSNNEFLYELPSKYGSGFLFITEYFDGVTFNQEPPNAKDVVNMSKYLAKMNNLTFSSVPEKDFWVLIYLVEEYSTKKSYLSEEDIKLTSNIVEKMGALDFSQFSKGVVHYDLHRDNAMKDARENYCIFDLATVENNYTVLDLATFLGLFVLDPNLSIDENKDRYSSAIETYEGERKLNSVERDSLWPLIKAIFVGNVMAANYLIKAEDDDTDETYKWYELGKRNLIKYQEVSF